MKNNLDYLNEQILKAMLNKFHLDSDTCMQILISSNAMPEKNVT
jgi:hypothetical protein